MKKKIVFQNIAVYLFMYRAQAALVRKIKNLFFVEYEVSF